MSSCLLLVVEVAAVVAATVVLHSAANTSQYRYVLATVSVFVWAGMGAYGGYTGSLLLLFFRTHAVVRLTIESQTGLSVHAVRQIGNLSDSQQTEAGCRPDTKRTKNVIHPS